MIELSNVIMFGPRGWPDFGRSGQAVLQIIFYPKNFGLAGEVNFFEPD